MRWALGLSGALSIAFGVVIIVWPGISLFALVILFGAFAFASGIVGLGSAISSPIARAAAGSSSRASLDRARRGRVLLDRHVRACAALRDRRLRDRARDLRDRGRVLASASTTPTAPSSGLTGLVSILFGIVMFAKPGDGALVLLALIAAYALIVGVTELVVAIGGKQLVESAARRSMTPPPPTARAAGLTLIQWARGPDRAARAYPPIPERP